MKKWIISLYVKRIDFYRLLGSCKVEGVSFDIHDPGGHTR
jgi:hypothetical protein